MMRFVTVQKANKGSHSEGTRGFPGGKESACQYRRCERLRFDPWVGKTRWSRKWQPTSVFLPRKLHGQRSLAENSPWGRKETNMTEYATDWLSEWRNKLSRHVLLFGSVLQIYCLFGLVAESELRRAKILFSCDQQFPSFPFASFSSFVKWRHHSGWTLRNGSTRFLCPMAPKEEGTLEMHLNWSEAEKDEVWE